MWLFLLENSMEIKNIYIYSDESGTFDRFHNDYFVFGGVICFSEEEKNITTRKYAHVEKVIRESTNFSSSKELKACFVSNEAKGKIFRSLNGVYKFCVLIKQKAVNYKVFENTKHKQRYLDYAYKIVLRKCLELIIEKKYLLSKEVRIVYVHADEHVTATDGKYELRESLLNEFKNGTFNPTWETHYDPIFPNLWDVDVKFCDSKKVRLVRAADIIANHCYHKALKFNGVIEDERNMFVYYLPGNYIGETGLSYFECSQSEPSLV